MLATKLKYWIYIQLRFSLYSIGHELYLLKQYIFFTKLCTFSFSIQAHIEALSYEGFKHACGGTIVSETHIVTAAHCIHGLSQREVRVKVGDSDSRTPDPSEKIFEIENWKIHPHFQQGEYAMTTHV